MKHIRNSAKAIIIRDGCLLLTRNVDSDGDWYIPPGGGQHYGETLHDALRRECQEEIGTSVRIGSLRWVREYLGKNHEFAEEDGDAHQVEFWFECAVDADYVPQMGHTIDTDQTGVNWLPITDLEQYRLYPKILKTILAKGMGEEPLTYLGDVN